MVQEVLDIIRGYNTVIIHRHIHPDLDALGSQGALAEILKISFPNKNIYIVGEEDKSLKFVKRMDDISDSEYNGSLIIICDTDCESRISDKRYKKGDFILKIDHHPNVVPYGDLNWTDVSASSTSEMIYDLFNNGKNGLLLTNEAARLIYAGIIGDTGRLLFNNTTNKTFSIVNELQKWDFSIEDLYTDIYKCNLNLTRLKGYILQHFHISKSGVGYIKIRNNILEKYKVMPNEVTHIINIFSDVDGIKAWTFFIDEKDHIKVRIRSKKIPIDQVAQQYGGGGHFLSAGATIHTWDEAETMLQQLENHVNVHALVDYH
ncbi:bifunctional oligoribonuclease/PAP phosphatase NrnA [Salicibibacter cibarius]|uniref:Bifunctional oligoribonuclease/PAP phosphatase NrnA n=1 Tax=Salicibibacter cibarius TaxID=2743000 RepID=A0A7T6Z073_9BACI|nr:bifunctional oligoribonuclease/PAP phosphatase NrnA [Salicibibacter cibarius]QQK74393.1 bifunctional oligoribonuclease/PAP phosphatase NrnA [Salicibibacter cibarius]